MKMPMTCNDAAHAMLANKMGRCSTRWLYLVAVSMVSVALPLFLLALSCMLHSTLARVVVTTNPHMPAMPLPTEACQDAGSSSSCTRALFLNPNHVVAAPAALQADTFSHVQHVQYLDTVVPVCVTAAQTPLISSVFPIYACNSRYHFRQPWRLSHLQLPFKIALVSSLDVAGVREVAVDANKAADSWFVGYSWSLLVCGGADDDGCDGETHLGWRYSSASGHVFYALIVDYDEQRPTIASVSALPTVVPSSVRFGMPSSASFLL
jgi:hypothetical protein